jgi:hypothetical protein
MKTFIDWLGEGHLLPDRRPTGLATRINPTPFTQPQLQAMRGKPPKLPKPKPIQVRKDPALQVQVGSMPTPFPDAITALNGLGIDLLPPRDDELEKVIEKDDQRPRRPLTRTASGGISLGASSTCRYQTEAGAEKRSSWT